MSAVKHQLGLKIWAYVFLFLPMSLSAMTGNGIMSAYQTQKPFGTMTGKIENITDANRLISCLATCMINTCGCKVALFDKNQPKTLRCLHASYGSHTINLSKFPGFLYYFNKQQHQEVGRDLSGPHPVRDCISHWTMPKQEVQNQEM